VCLKWNSHASQSEALTSNLSTVKEKENVLDSFINNFFFFPLGMPSASLLVNLLSALLIHFAFGETEIRFAGQTEFIVNETSTTVIRLVIERIGEPANVTAVVSVRSYYSTILT
jgi:hypothetical protein